jgi:hypothetical protein
MSATEKKYLCCAKSQGQTEDQSRHCLCFYPSTCTFALHPSHRTQQLSGCYESPRFNFHLEERLLSFGVFGEIQGLSRFHNSLSLFTNSFVMHVSECTPILSNNVNNKVHSFTLQIVYCLTATRFGLISYLQGDIDTTGRNSSLYVPSSTIKSIKIRTHPYVN